MTGQGYPPGAETSWLLPAGRCCAQGRELRPDQGPIDLAVIGRRAFWRADAGHLAAIESFISPGS